MCAILDADVVSEAFGPDATLAGQFFRQAIDNGGLKLIIGGKLLDELDQNRNFKAWRAVAVLYGRAELRPQEIIDLRTHELISSKSCESNDAHVIALAQLSSARLLYSNDKRLHRDFKRKQLIDNPRGKIYTTNENSSVTRTHRRLVNDQSLCTLSK